MRLTLSHSHQETYDAIFRHPAVHNLHWREVRSMLGAMAEVVEEPNGSTRVTRNGQTLILHPERQADVGTEEQLKELRVFLGRTNADVRPATADGVNLLVVLDHRQARIYKTVSAGSIPERIVPHDADGAGRHLHYVQNDSNGQRRPEQKPFYESISKSLRGAKEILLFGGGTGASSAMEQLVAYLAYEHKDVAARVVGTVVVDDHHTTEEQLVAKAREFYASLPAKATGAPA